MRVSTWSRSALLLIPLGAGIAWTAAIRNPLAAAGRAASRASPWRWRRGSPSNGSAPSCSGSASYVGLRGPGLFWIVPFVDSVTKWIDQRVITTSFAAEETLTSDTVPVNVDAVLFWLVYDPEKAALEVQDYQQAVSWAAQTALRDIIGRTSLTDLLRGRERIEEELQKLIDARSNPWGVTVQSVEMRDVVIPESLQDAMSREAQASREKQARVILGQAEVEIAHSFAKAVRVVPQQPDGAAPARDEHALRRAEGEGRADAGPELGGRVDGDGRPDGRGGAEAGRAGRLGHAPPIKIESICRTPTVRAVTSERVPYLARLPRVVQTGLHAVAVADLRPASS